MTYPDQRGSSEQRRAIREARDALRPSADFMERLDQALAEAPAMPQRRGFLSTLKQWTELPLVLSAGMSVLVAVYVCWDTPVFDDFRIAEHSLEVPADGTALVPLELALHHHGGDWAEIAVSAPRELSVANPMGSEVPPLTCKANRCSYELTGHSRDTVPAMHVKIDRPGRYRMEIEHRSRVANVREVFVIHARR